MADLAGIKNVISLICGRWLAEICPLTVEYVPPKRLLFVGICHIEAKWMHAVAFQTAAE